MAVCRLGDQMAFSARNAVDLSQLSRAPRFSTPALLLIVSAADYEGKQG